MQLEDFKNLNINSLGSLPVPVKAVLLALVFFAILILGYYFIWTEAYASIDAAKAKETELRQVFLTKKAQAVNLKAYKLQMVEIEKTFGTMLKQLPDKSQMDGLLSDINQAGIARGLEFELFKPGQETQEEFYAELPISIKVIGNYHQLGAFATDISKLPRIVTLNNVAIATNSKDSNSKLASTDSLLTMEAIAKTYRYLDADEIAQKKKAEKMAKDKSAK